MCVKSRHSFISTDRNVQVFRFQDTILENLNICDTNCVAGAKGRHLEQIGLHIVTAAAKMAAEAEVSWKCLHSKFHVINESTHVSSNV